MIGKQHFVTLGSLNYYTRILDIHLHKQTEYGLSDDPVGGQLHSSTDYKHKAKLTHSTTLFFVIQLKQSIQTHSEQANFSNNCTVCSAASLSLAKPVFPSRTFVAKISLLRVRPFKCLNFAHAREKYIVMIHVNFEYV